MANPTNRKNSLINLVLQFADTNLVLAQRNAEWCGHGPVLEQDIAITNISLDLLGQARNFYQYAATLIGEDMDEDKLAYFRPEREFKNLLLAEQPNGDWAQTVLKLFLFCQFQFLFYSEMENSTDPQLVAIATKSLKETSYHLRWSREWVIRLGDGTAESRNRMNKAIATVWEYTGELFQPTDYERECTENGILVSCESLQNYWTENVQAVFAEAGLEIPGNTFMQQGGKNGIHTEHLGFILTELQYLQRSYPGCEW
jgi:ring-1,2-phenylacetyl-CoA epoxidase subunit PaaC